MQRQPLAARSAVAGHASDGINRLNVSIERVVEEDAETLVKLQIAAFHYDSQLYPGIEVGGPPGYDSVAVMLRKIEEDECYKIIVDGQCIGGIVAILMDEAHCHLDLIFLDPAYHNRGIGTHAMRWLEGAYPVRRWTLDTPEWAVRNRRFYEKLGYVKVAEHEHDGTPLIAYEKQLLQG